MVVQVFFFYFIFIIHSTFLLSVLNDIYSTLFSIYQLLQQSMSLSVRKMADGQIRQIVKSEIDYFNIQQFKTYIYC